MLARAFLVPALVVSLSACPSGPDPHVPSSSGQTTSNHGPANAPATSALASLDPNRAKQETWTLERGPAPFLNFEAEHLRISASCRLPTGQMDCEALRFARKGPSVELTAQDRSRAAPPGALICMKTKNQLATGRDAKGNEDGFCVFSDGSMIATGSLEYHTLK